MRPAPVTTKATTPADLAEIRRLLGALPKPGTPGRVALMSDIARRLTAAGIEISDDEGHWLEAEAVMPHIGGPSFGSEYHTFCDGYWQAAERGYGPEDFSTQGGIDGAALYWELLSALRDVIENEAAQ
jgi:hypothetical protein